MIFANSLAHLGLKISFDLVDFRELGRSPAAIAAEVVYPGTQ